MGLFFYNIFLLLFKAGVRIAGILGGKPKKWVSGRQHIFEKLETAIGPGGNIVWMHCASLGEFEQGRPLLEKLRSQYPDHKFLLTFFSPSGYEIRKNYTGANWVFYLPMDGPRNANRFLQIVNPSLVIFVKYEFWYYYLKEVKKNNTPLLLVSAVFRENSGFFKWYGGLQRNMLYFFDQLFVQNEASKKLLDSIGLANSCTVAGDTRFDRVIEIAETAEAIPIIEQFTAKHRTIVAGSTWPEDEELLQKAIQAISDASLQLIIAPHEINKEHIARLQKLFPASVLFSEISKGNEPRGMGNRQPVSVNILIIDNIGMLSRLYKYAYITYIGGGFGKGIHNTLEAAVYGKPVLFGPAYHKFNEAVELIQAGGAIGINHTGDIVSSIQRLLQDEKEYAKTCKSAGNYVYANKGATEKILRFIQENRLLTN